MRPARGSSIALFLLIAPLLAQAAGPAPDDAVLAYTTQRGDTVIGLSRQLLTEPARWRELARANALRDPNRITPGQVLRIPLAWVRSEPAPARVVAVGGDVRGDVAVGQALPEGASVATGPGGNVAVQLVDGTLLKLRGDSRLQLTESRRLPIAGATRAGAKLDAGRVEVEAGHAGAGLPGFRVRTPQGVLAVRGTSFRVDSDSAAALTRGEVLQGTVAVDAQPVPAGFGSVVDATGHVTPPVPLLPAPDLQALPALQERVLLRFSLPPCDGARAWRGQVARDASFETVVAEVRSTTPELRFADLPDGDWLLRVRAIDGQGLEGRDAELRFRLKARPEPPLPSTPAPGAVLYEAHVDFGWAANAEAARYRFQLADERGFDAPLRELPDLATTSAAVDALPPGHYRWRLRSVRPDGDLGPWGDARAFELRPPPPVPPPPRVDDHAMHFAWDGQPGQRFDFQLARDAAFTAGLVSQELAGPQLDLPLPGSGRFWVRLRVRDPDGFIGPWTTPQSIDLPNCLRDGQGDCVRGGEGRFQVAP